MGIENGNNSNLENSQGKLSESLKGQSALSKHFEESADRFTKKTLKKTNNIIGNPEKVNDLVTIDMSFILEFQGIGEKVEDMDAHIITYEVVENYLTKGETITPFELYTYIKNIIIDSRRSTYQGGKKAGNKVPDHLTSLEFDPDKINAVILEIVKETFGEDAFNNNTRLKELYDQNYSKIFERAKELEIKKISNYNLLELEDSDEFIFPKNYDELTNNIDTIDNNRNRPKAKKHTYSLEKSQKYLDELNEEYPIQEVFGEHLAKYMLSDENLKMLLNYDFAGEAELEKELFVIIKESLRAHKWVGKKSIKLLSASLKDLKGGKYWDITIENSMKYNILGFYNNNEVTGLKDKALSFMGIKESSEDIYMFPKENLIRFIKDRIEVLAKDEKKEKTKLSNEIEDVIDKIQPQGHKDLSLPILQFIIEGYRNFENNSKQSIKRFVYEQIKDGSESIPQLEVLGQSILEVFDNMIKHGYIKGVGNETKLDLRFNDEKLNVYFGLDLINEGEETKLKIVGYERFIKVSTEGVNTGLSPYDVEDMINCFTKFNLSSREEIIHYIESENKRILKEDTYTEEDLEKRLNTQITILENMIRNGHIIEGKNGKLNLNIRFKEEPVNKLYGI